MALCQVILCYGGLPCVLKDDSVISGLCLLDASVAPRPLRCDYQKCLQLSLKARWKAKFPQLKVTGLHEYQYLHL